MAITHTKVSAIADDPAASAAGEVLPSDWNDDHVIADGTITLAKMADLETAKVIGRMTAGTGVPEALGTTGTGNVVFSTSPTLVTPLLGTPTSGTLTNCTGLPAAGVVGTAAVLGANTFTALQTITQASANAGILASTGYSLTGSNATNMVDLAGTWNTSGAPGAIKVSITDTASNANSQMIVCYAGAAGATNVFTVYKGGNVSCNGICAIGTNGATNLKIEGNNTQIDQMSYFSGTFSIARLTSNIVFGWSSGAANATSIDTALSRNAAGVVEVNNGTAGTFRDLIARSLFCAPSSANGQSVAIKSLTELLTIAAAATSTTTIQIPAGAIVVSVNVRVTTAVTCTSTFTVGDGTTADKFNTAAVSKAVNSTDKGTKAGAVYYAAATSIVITPDTVPSDATGRVRVTIAYLEATAPTS